MTGAAGPELRKRSGGVSEGVGISAPTADLGAGSVSAASES